MKKKKKRFRKKGGKRSGQRDQRLLKAAKELHSQDDDGWSDQWQDQVSPSLVARSEQSKGKTSKPEPRRDQPAWEPEGEIFSGTVVSLASAIAWVARADGQIEQCGLPTAIAQDQRSRVAVGDRVKFAARGDDFLLYEVLPRDTWLARPDPLNPRLQRVVAANIHTVVQVASVVKPPLRPALLDRYLVAIQHGGALPVVCINKVDLLSPDEREQELAPLTPYRRLGVPVIECSTVDGRGIEALRQLLKNKTAAFVGHSGVGKSSLVNALSPATDAATGEVSESRGTGRHTTTRSNLYTLGDGIRLIDTPGIREFGLWNLSPEGLREYFSDFHEPAAACKFSNCSHSHEPRCGVRQAVDDGRLSAARYETYLRILDTL